MLIDVSFAETMNQATQQESGQPVSAVKVMQAMEVDGNKHIQC